MLSHFFCAIYFLILFYPLQLSILICTFSVFIPRTLFTSFFLRLSFCFCLCILFIVSACLLVYLSICLSIYTPIKAIIYLLLHIYTTFHQCIAIYLLFHLSAFISFMTLSFSLSIYSSLTQSIYLFV